MFISASLPDAMYTLQLELACFSSKIMCFLVLPGLNYKINKFEC